MQKEQTDRANDFEKQTAVLLEKICPKSTIYTDKESTIPEKSKI
jgi:hypothetical protein